MSRSHAIRGLIVAILLVVSPAARRVEAQAIDPASGEIVGSQFLALGPFANTFGCGDQADILSNHVAPSYLQAQYPEEGDEVEYDPELASSTGYHELAPRSANGNPVWRLWDDGSSFDGDQDMGTDTVIGANLDDHVTFLATYVDFGGDDGTLVDVCVRSDDGVQVWWNCDLLISNNACRGRGVAGDCQDLATVEVSAGVHRIIIGVWERGGGWGGSVRLIDNATGLTIDETNGDWFFLGPEGDGEARTCEICDPVVLSPCSYSCAEDGSLSVNLTWENPEQPETCSGIEEIIVRLNGEIVGELAADATSFEIPSDLLDGSGGTIEIDNGAVFPASCVLPSAGNIAPRGIATQSSSFGANQFPANFALDGNFDNFTHTASGQFPAVWELDLGETFPIDTIVLHNRRNCCGSRLRDITVEILDEPDGLPIFVSDLLNPENELGAFPNGPAMLTVNVREIEGDAVEGQIVRVTRTVDEDLSGSGGQGNADEGAVLSLAEVEVIVDVCSGSTRCEPVTNLVCGESSCDGLELSWTNPAACDSPIRVLIDGDEAMSLAAGETRVVVPASSVPSSGGRVTIDNGALFPPSCDFGGFPDGIATQSTTLDPFGPELALDGILGNFTHTQSGAGEGSWQVDFGAPFLIEGVTIFNRTSCCGSRLRDITVFILDEPDGLPVFESELLNPENELGAFPDGPATLEVTLDDLGGRPVLGQVVRIVRTIDEDLSGSQGQGNVDEAEVLSLGEVVVAVSCDDIEPPVESFVRGDSDSSGTINLTDGVVPLLFLFSGGRPPECFDAADTDDSGGLAITDAIIIFQWLFNGGMAPRAPAPSTTMYPRAECGEDMTADGIGCAVLAPQCS